MSEAAAQGQGGLAIICGGGTLPFALADAAKRRGRRVVLFGLRGWADPLRVTAYPHHWVWIGQFGRFKQLAKTEDCHDVVFIGSVERPTLRGMRPDLGLLRLMPRLVRLFRGGDDHLLSGVGRTFEQHGFRWLGIQDIAPEFVIPHGPIGGRAPAEQDRADIARGLALLDAMSPFDIGQAVVVANNHVLAVEGPEGTDRTLARVAEMRRDGRIRSPAGTGVLVKAPKSGQDRRIDLPAIGPATVDAASAAGLAGIAVAAGSTLMAEPDRLIAAADRAGIFVIGVDSNGPGR